jgi:hypothetical protein
MSDYLLRFSPGEMIALVSIVGGLVLGSLVLMGDCWRRVRKVEIESNLKASMLDRGLSAEEIRCVLEAGRKPWYE